MSESQNLSKREENILSTTMNHTCKNKISLIFNILKNTDNCLKYNFPNSNSYKNRSQNKRFIAK